MRSTNHEYQFSCTFLDLNRLQKDIVSLNPKVINILKHMNTLKVRSNDPLDSDELSAIQLLLNSFVDIDPDQKLPLIYDIAKSEAYSKHFHNIDYKKELTKSLIPLRTVTKGEVTKVEWYTDLDESLNPINMVLFTDISYQRDSSGFATSRTTSRTWINRDGSENEESKVTSKYYFVNPSDMIDEGLKRRKLLVNSIQIPTLTFMKEVLMPQNYTEDAVLLKGREFMDDYENDFNKFVDNSSTITNPADPNFGKKTIIVELEDNTPGGRNADYNLWLDAAPASLGGLTTIRQYLINEFNI